MNTIHRLVCVLILGCLTTSMLLANTSYPSHFSNDRDVFIKELESFLTEKKRKPLLEIFQKFENAYHSGSFSEEQVRTLIEVSNRMLDRKLAAEPYFQQYLECLLILNEPRNRNQWESWQMTWGTMVQEKATFSARLLKRTLKFSHHFFTQATLTEGRSAVTWEVDQTPIWKIESGQPILQFDQTTLVAQGRKNQLIITEAAGTFNPVKKQWIGSAGNTNWQRLGRPDIRATLKQYQIDVKKNRYTANEAFLEYPDYWTNQKVKGTLKDRLNQQTKEELATFPCFTATEMQWMQQDSHGVKLYGFFQLSGLKEKMLGQEGQQAQLIKTSLEGQLRFKAYSSDFSLKTSGIYSQAAAISIPCYQKDSIYHPLVKLRYQNDQDRLYIQRNTKFALGRRYFTDSYTRMQIEAEQISWWLTQDSLLLNPKGLTDELGSGDVVLASSQFFDVRQYRQLQGPASRHPVATLQWLCSEKNVDRVSATEFAHRLHPNLEATQIHPLLGDLMAKGYINWDQRDDIVTVLPKARHYAQADQGQLDYDQIRLVSNHHEANASFQFGEQQWQTEGVKIVEFSGPRQVAAKPQNGQVKLLQNRGLQFDGQLYAGLGIFEGERLQFDYEPFVIRLDSVAYFDVFLPEETPYAAADKTPVGLSIGSRLENLTGVLYIDRADNKSGQDTSSHYPAFSSESPSFVYYDQADSNYLRQNFFFTLDPFKLDNLGQLAANQMVFPGQMTSADIFPNFRETLLLQEDQSLGFTHQTTSDGYALYQQRGQYTGQILLSNEGFYGQGHFSYRWANIDSKDIYFQPNRLTCSADKFELSEVRDALIEIPAVIGRSVAIDWKPYRDSMYIRSADQAFELFSKPGYQLNGLLILTPDGLHGRGKANWPAGGVAADLLSFGAYSIQSDSCNLSIQTQGVVNELALATENVKADLNFDNQMGYIRARVDTVTTSLPYNKYRTSMNSYDWDMKNESVLFHSGDQKVGYFWCTDEKQEGIHFDGTEAGYDLKSSVLKIGGVEKIQIADTWLYPDSGRVAILKDGRMKTLQQARFVMDTLNRYHEITGVTIDVKGKNSFQASGDYVYRIGSLEQQIHFNSIQATRMGKGRKKDRQILTKAETVISEADQFRLAQRMRYQGQIQLQSNWPGLQFDGYVRLDDDRLPNTRWFRINYQGNQKQPILPLSSEMLDPQENTLFTGLFVNHLTGDIYPSVLGYKKQKEDRALAEIQGFLRYDKPADVYLLGDSLRVYHATNRGVLFRVEKPGDGFTLEGPLEVGEELTSVMTQLAGITTTGISKDARTKAEVMAQLNFPLSEKVWKIIAQDLKSSSLDAKPIDYYNYDDFHEKTLSYFIPNAKELKQTIVGLKSGARYLPKELGQASLLLSHLGLEWNAEQRAFTNPSGKAAYFAIGDQPVHRWYETYVKIQQYPGGGDRFQFYVKSPSGFYYYLELRNEVLGIVSNNPKLTEVIEGLKDKEFEQEAANGQKIELNVLAPTVAQRFVRNFE